MSILVNRKEKDNSEEEEDEEVLLQRLRRPSSLVDDLVTALYEVRLILPFVLVAALFAAYSLFIAPYRTVIDRPKISQEDLAKLRPVLSADQQRGVREEIFWAETSARLEHATISFAFQPHVNQHGSFYLPDFFYEGFLVGITAENSHNLTFIAQNRRSLQELRKELEETAAPRASSLLPRESRNEKSGWQERGWLAYYSYSDLARQGLLSSDASRPFRRALDRILSVARRYKQIYVTIYFPHTFGKHTEQQEEEQRGGGLDGLKSSCAVWLTAINGEEPQLFGDSVLPSLLLPSEKNHHEL
eukprot:gene7673-8480_t